jgi:hypothetical protein
MRSRVYFFIASGLIAVGLIAFFLREVVQDWVVIPLARLFWLIKGYYGAFPQATYWGIALIVAAVLVLLWLRLPDFERPHQPEQWKPSPGSVREMAFWIQRSKEGIFPKWHLAHLLAELALDILNRRRTRQKDAGFLDDPDWSPPPNVKKYLDAVLSTNYTDYPRQTRFRQDPPTPFDQDLDPVVEYLESLLEIENDNNS